MAHIHFEKFCVRVKSPNHTGSGVIIPVNDILYVLTAAHCLGENHPDLADIKVEKQRDYNSDFEELEIIEIIEFNLENDFALLKLNPQDEELIQLKYKLGIGILADNQVKFCGYQGINIDQYRPFSGKTLTVTDDQNQFKITLEGNTFDQGGEEANHIAKGLSGSGVFIYRHNSPFLIGILNSIITDKAWNDDIECCSIKHIVDHIPEFVDLSDFENLVKWDENVEKERTKREIEAFEKDNVDFFKKLYRKNQVLYPDIIRAKKVTAKQISKFLAMKENIETLGLNFPWLHSKFAGIVNKYVDQVKDDYSQAVNESSEAIALKRELQSELKSEFDFLPNDGNLDLSEYQIIEWLGICTLNFRNND